MKICIGWVDWVSSQAALGEKLASRIARPPIVVCSLTRSALVLFGAPFYIDLRSQLLFLTGEIYQF
jgi:hypothetical protein